MIDLHTLINESSGRCYIDAPAGFGKTALIAKTITGSNRKFLLLTHTFAGVNSIRNKIASTNEPINFYQLDTIASWALRLCIAYPKISGWSKGNPETNRDWDLLYASCEKLLLNENIYSAIQLNYEKILVDEYQDCSKEQHSLLLILSRSIDICIFGDPLQSIFMFSGNLVNWDTEIYNNFELIGTLKTPWRWINDGKHEIAKWLTLVRENLISNGSIDVRNNLPVGVKFSDVDLTDHSDGRRFRILYEHSNTEESVAIIFPGNPTSKAKTHKLALSTSGRFTSLEEIEGKSLQKFIKDYEKAVTPKQKLVLFINFLKSCLIGVTSNIAKPTLCGEIYSIRRNTKNPAITEAANSYLNNPSLLNLAIFAKHVKEVSYPYRRDLLSRFFGVIKEFQTGSHNDLTSAFHSYRLYFRIYGRPVKHNRIIATTLLLKGLEYDHVIIADTKNMTDNELYVSLTRGKKTITITK
jgi:UvrD/REP helicase N-terminal domain